MKLVAVTVEGSIGLEKVKANTRSAWLWIDPLVTLSLSKSGGVVSGRRVTVIGSVVATLPAVSVVCTARVTWFEPFVAMLGRTVERSNG